jgi:hypothetical protein
MYKQIAIIVLLAMALIMSGCGSSNGGNGSGNINGTWMATLNDANGSPVYTFSTTFTREVAARSASPISISRRLARVSLRIKRRKPVLSL